MPQSQGFDYSFGHIGGCIDNYSHYFYWNGPNRHDLWRNGEEIYREGENFSDLMVEESVRFIEGNKDRPFFLFFSSNYPHYPLQGDRKWREHYRHLPHPRDKYAAMVSTVDEKIGRVLDKIAAEGLKGNTIVVFMSDNGYSTEDRTFGGGGSAGNLRGAKFSCFEGGIRVPAVISCPGLLPENEVRDQPAFGFDWFPTILDLCGVPLPDVHLDGKSLATVIRSAGEKSPHDAETVFWEVGKSWAVRKDRFKLVYDAGRLASATTAALYDLDADVNERHDVSSQYPQVVKELQQARVEWGRGVGN
jgi:arylsulfatase A-like enzyme